MGILMLVKCTVLVTCQSALLDNVSYIVYDISYNDTHIVFDFGIQYHKPKTMEHFVLVLSYVYIAS